MISSCPKLIALLASIAFTGQLTSVWAITSTPSGVATGITTVWTTAHFAHGTWLAVATHRGVSAASVVSFWSIETRVARVHVSFGGVVHQLAVVWSWGTLVVLVRGSLAAFKNATARLEAVDGFHW